MADLVVYSPEFVLMKNASKRPSEMYSANKSTEPTPSTNTSSQNLLEPVQSYKSSASSTKSKSRASSLLSRVRSSLDEGRKAKEAEQAALKARKAPPSPDAKKLQPGSVYATSYGAVSSNYTVFERGIQN